MVKLQLARDDEIHLPFPLLLFVSSVEGNFPGIDTGSRCRLLSLFTFGFGRKPADFIHESLFILEERARTRIASLFDKAIRMPNSLKRT